jgi:hypothetical protein
MGQEVRRDTGAIVITCLDRSGPQTLQESLGAGAITLHHQGLGPDNMVNQIAVLKHCLSCQTRLYAHYSLDLCQCSIAT